MELNESAYADLIISLGESIRMEKCKEQYQKLSDELRHCIWNFPFNFRQKFEDALAHNFPIDFQDENGWTLLLESAWDKDATKVGVTGILLDYGADPNLENKLKYRPLDVAIYRQCPLELVYRLIKAGLMLMRKTVVVKLHFLMLLNNISTVIVSKSINMALRLRNFFLNTKLIHILIANGRRYMVMILNQYVKNAIS